ncbi:FAD-linked oxidoreductase (plasmid) [Natrialba magadii ATCC 43099]|uniref:FAD-linked oxidoreductase n=1 Tax=Natrialba magadii (strain ATCC 43099 / DSM 3394 / CCM 3739 / CIP 104546 / IAM 13178 / JCM 8861 / NBRC 102185 / NCIMB 2190 / MS3) TaxID=547559 RepID=D3T1J2_NATMM|nr:D-arabinono-1,4-lactone oxidase [Natrialba magadii]ADD07451.1 FAD-linked oxidoreductase [Natrialba magadii ATCC 43099]ELY32257.1 FAD-linked oxidoreductase [Natrialba magadii ATCC 43099]
MEQDTIDEDTSEMWTNWSGSISFEPDRILEPESETELQSIVRECAERGETVRVVGSGHSWTPVVETDGVLVSLSKMTGLISHDADAKTATLYAGTTLEEAGTELHDRNLAMPNLGDVSMQTVAGAFGTGTHGTGPEFENLSGTLIGGRMVTGTGDVREFSAEEDPDLLRAAQLSLGTLGIFTEIELDLQTTYKIQRREYCTNWRACKDHIPTLIEENRNFDFYWYPRSNEVKLRLLNAPGGGTDHEDLSYATQVEDQTGWWQEIIPEHDDIGREFDEMEYALPVEDGLDCFERVRERVRERWRADVGWRLLVRTVAADDAMLSAEYDRDVMTISCIQNAELDHWEYFEDIEPIFHEYDGRPHWGKKHTLRAPELRELYPEWDQFQELRRELDPDGVFMTDYLEKLLEEGDS